MESLIGGLGVAAGAGWGVAAGLAVALWVALRHITERPPPQVHVLQQEADVEKYPFGRRAS